MVRLFNLEDGVVRIQGTSGQAAALPRILEDSRYFREVEMVAGITRDSKGRETYNIQARLEDPLPLAGGAGLSAPPNPGSRPPRPLTDNPASAEAAPDPAEVPSAPAEAAPQPATENAPPPEAAPAPPSEDAPEEATP